MADKTQYFIKSNWTGGLNDSVDPGVLPDSDLVIADHVLPSTTGSRLKRPGFEYWDNIELPAVTSVTRASTTITVTFAGAIQSGTNDKLVVGEKITVVTSDSQFNATNVAIDSVPSTTTITYTVGVAPTAASATFTSLTRTSSVIGQKDFWSYSVSNGVKEQIHLAATSQAKVFKYDSSGNRKELTNATNAVTFTDAGDTVTLNSHGFKEGDAVGFTSITSTTGIFTNTIYYVGGTIAANTFQLSATKGGSALSLTTNGSGTLVSPLFTTSGNTFAEFEAINERCIITLSGANNTPKIYEPQTSTTTIRGLKGAPPNGSFMRQYQGRVIMNSKTEPDRAYASSPFNPEEWSGYGDSLVIDIGLGDGDPAGLTAFYPEFQGTLYVTKLNKTYKLPGADLATAPIVEVSSGLGGAGNRTICPVDFNDVVYVSDKGIHSLATTDKYGDFQEAFLSTKIQSSYSGFDFNNLKNASAVYVSRLNSIFFALPTTAFEADQNDCIYVYNTKFKEWYRWPEVSAASLVLRDNSRLKQVILGSYDSRLFTTSSEFSDYGDSPIRYKIQTGTIYVDGNPLTMKSFKSVGFLYRPRGGYSFTAKIKIDNHSTQSFDFSQSGAGGTLGTNLTLGTTTLAASNVLAPYSLPLDGIGRGLTITIEQSTLDAQVEIYGFVIGYELAETAQEVIQTTNLSEGE